MLDLSTHITPELTAWAKSLTPEALTTAPDWIVDEHCQSQVAPPELEAVLHAATEEASREAGVPLYPVNSFLRRYERGAVLKPHTDRTENEWTASLRLYHEGPEWPLHTADGPLTGDTVFMRSHDIEHWRDPLPGHVSVVGLLHWSSRPPAAADGFSLISPPATFCAADQKVVRPVRNHEAPFVVVPHLLHAYQIDTLYKQLGGQEMVPGVVDGRERKIDVRNNTVTWLEKRAGWEWLYDAMFYAAENINQQQWQRDIRGDNPSRIQFTRYHVGEFYDWHEDRTVGGGESLIGKRSVSVIVLLKNPDYGGGLEFEHGGVIHLFSGDAIVFPADALHRALPVGKGTRECLVQWLLRN